MSPDLGQPDIPSVRDTPLPQTGAGAEAAPQLAFSEQTGAVGGNTFPAMIGDIFGICSPSGGGLTLGNTVRYSVPVNGFYVVGDPGDTDASIAYFVTGGDGNPDFFSIGNSLNAGGTEYEITEPIPPTDAPTSPGPTFFFDGGTATYNDDGMIVNGGSWEAVYSYTETIGNGNGPGKVPYVAGSGGVVVGRLKIADNTSPLPRDRFFVNYNMFDNVPLVTGGVTVNRITPGFEKTLFNGQSSFEMRFPFASTLSNSLFADGPNDFSNAEFGNVYLTWKSILARRGNRFLTGGCSVAVPTADDFTVGIAQDNATKELLRIKNESVHLLPFIGWLVARPSGFFSQGFVQVDIDANGNSVLANTTGERDAIRQLDVLTDIGVINEAALLYVDSSIGYFWTPRSSGRRLLTAVIPTIEWHFNRSLQTFDAVESGAFQIGERFRDVSVLNLVYGLTFQFGRGSQITFGYANPVGNGPDQQFDGELRVLFNQYL